jgi:hypothetical protein
MDWTEAEARLVTLEREVTRHQRLAREHQALAGEDGRVAAVVHGPAVARDPRRGRWLGLGHWLWRRLPLPAEPAPTVGNPIANAPRVA